MTKDKTTKALESLIDRNATTHNRVRVYRRFPSTHETTLGYAVYKADANGGGWVFFPEVFGRHPSRKFYPTWEECLPAWVGFPNLCSSEYVKVVKG
jgi:hypothetical protein